MIPENKIQNQMKVNYQMRGDCQNLNRTSRVIFVRLVVDKLTLQTLLDMINQEVT